MNKDMARCCVHEPGKQNGNEKRILYKKQEWNIFLLVKKKT
jgi:hypothetical protein